MGTDLNIIQAVYASALQACVGSTLQGPCEHSDPFRRLPIPPAPPGMEQNYQEAGQRARRLRSE